MVEDNNYEGIVCNLNSLYEAYIASKRNSDWKRQVQLYEKNFLKNIVHIKDDLQNRTYSARPKSEFILQERGKIRAITGYQMADRVIRHSLCDNVLIPILKDYLIYNNGSSLKGKGITFARNEFEKDIHAFYREHNSNDGYILLWDYTKYYDNLWHDNIRIFTEDAINDEFILWMLDGILSEFKIDVSYLSDDEYEAIIHIPFNSLDYRMNVTDDMKTGDRYLEKSVNIGDQTSGIIGLVYPREIDNYITIVKSQKYFGRYSDDNYLIHHDKQFLKDIFNEIQDKALDLGMFINEKKTKIIKLSNRFRYLQIQYTLTNTGKLIRRINPTRIRSMRLKLIKLAKKVESNERNKEDVEHMFIAWMGSYRSVMSEKQRDDLNIFYNELFGGFIDEQYYLRYYPKRRYSN